MQNRKKPKILFVAPLPPPFAGPETSAKLFSESSISEDFEIITLSTNFRTSNAQKGKFGLAMIFAWFQLNFKLLRSILKVRPQIVYYYVTATMLGWIGKDIWVILFSKLMGRKVVVHMRAGHFRKNYEASNPLFKFIVKRVLNLTDFNLAQSPSLTQQYKGLVKRTNLIGHVYNMISEADYFIDEDPDYDQDIVFFLGHLSHAKGYCDILRVMPEVVADFPNVKFCFAGTLIDEERNVFYNGVNGEPIVSSNPKTVFKEVIQSRFQRNYQYLGKLDSKEKIKWFRKSNIFILPSYSEGFSMSVLEAIAAGKPIITTPVGALKDILEHKKNAILVTPGDLQALRNALLEVLSNASLRNRLAENNRTLRTNFGVDQVVLDYKELFNKIL
jgi:glycosyltransferase involved in cell wall biosynthesis